MRYALINGERQEAAKGATGLCLCCGADVISKCGKIRCNHWAHKNNNECFYSQKESKTEWHLNWQNCFNKDWQEVRCVDEETGEVHIADIKTPKGLVVEFQHSAIKPEERLSREKYHKNIIWVVDGKRNKKIYQPGVSLFNTTNKVLLSAAYGFHEVIDGCETVHGEDNQKIKLFSCSKPECFFPKEWLGSPIPIFFDFHFFIKTYNTVKGIIFGVIFVKQKYYIVKLDSTCFIDMIKNDNLVYYLLKAFPLDF